MTRFRRQTRWAGGLILALVAGAVAAETVRDIGGGNALIKIGNIMPYSGPASAYGLIGRTEAAYFRKINAQGGIQGRKINFISYDDGYNPAKTIEQARRLVEKDRVLLIFQSLGTAPNTAIRSYMNAAKVPQLFVASGAAKWNDPFNFPWTMGWQPSYQVEAHAYAEYLLQARPHGRIGVLYQNDDYGKDYMRGLRDGLNGRIPIVAETSYEVSDVTISSQISKLQASGADIFFDVTTPRFAAQAIRTAAEIGWRPLHLLNNVSDSIGSVLKPAGFDNAQGTISTAYFKDPLDPAWKDDPGRKEWLAFMDKYLPGGDRSSNEAVYGYLAAQTLVQVLEQCGNELSRENIMKQAATLNNLQLDMLLPGISINTSSTDYSPIKQLQMQRFNGYTWELFGPVITGRPGG